MPAGRPTDYSPEVITKSLQYLKECIDSFGGDIKTVNLPSIEGLAIYLDINRDTIYKWEQDPDKKEFSDIVETIRAEQAKRLVNNGLSGNYNPTIAKLLLHKHGYSDKQEVEQSGTLNVNIVNYANGAADTNLPQ
jgi:hypothetical protein